MKQIVFSGIVLKSGGTLNVYYALLDEVLRQKFYEKYELVAFVSDAMLFARYTEYIKIVEIKVSGHLQRLWAELVTFKKYSKQHDVDIWISAHDLTPNVKARKIYTYCQTSFPFLENKERFKKYANMKFLKYYKYVYMINKRKATYIAQTEWMRENLKKKLGIKNVIVANPSFNIANDNLKDLKLNVEKKSDYTFIYPSLPRYYKNFEAVCEASKILNNKGITNFKIILNVKGDENSYAQMLKEKYGSIPNIIWTGALPHEDLIKLCFNTDCLVYTSLLESYTLPIMEYKSTGKPMIVAEKPYAAETIGNYALTKMVNPDDYNEIADAMEKAIKGEPVFTEHKLPVPQQPYAANYSELIKMIISN